MNRGKYIVLEGPEGVGKTTQLHELARRLQAAGLPVRVLREPDSQSDLTARAIRRLTQDPNYPMNTRTEVLLYNAARSQSLQTIRQSVENGVICLVDRNYLTTLAVQYYGRGDVPDYNTINGIIDFAVGGTEPDLCIVMDAPVPTLRERLKDRNQGERFDNLDDAFLERVRAGYLWEAKQRGLQVVFATEDAEKVANNIWQLVSATLAERSKPTQTSEPVSVKEVIESRSLPNKPTEETAETVSQEIDTHITLEGVSALLTQILEASRLATYTQSSPESSEQAPYYVPESLNPDIKKQYQEAMGTIFETHAVMLNKLSEYIQNSSEIDLETAQAQAFEIVQAVLPAATKITVSIDASDEALRSIIKRLLSHELPEAHLAGKNLLGAGQDIALDDLQAQVAYRAATARAVKKLAGDNLPDNYAVTPGEAVSLLDYWPKNELLLAPDMLYEHTNLPLEQLQSTVNDWSYDQKTLVFKTYMGDRQNAQQRPGRALEKAHYNWDVISDQAVFRDLQHYYMVDDPSAQLLTPRYGYDVPKLVEDAGLTEQFESCFDISLKLHGLLQKQVGPIEAQYATLRGHKMRWKLTYNAREAFRIHESQPTHPDTQKLIRQMHEKLAEVHPLIGESMTFVSNT